MLNSTNIIEVIDKLVGPTNPIGETNEDTKRYDSLKTLIDIINWCMDGLYYSAQNRHSFEGSVNLNAETAYGVMLELKEWLADKEEELA